MEKREPRMHPIKRLSYTQLAHLLGVKRWKAIRMVKEEIIRELTVAAYGEYKYAQGWNAAMTAAKQAVEESHVR